MTASRPLVAASSAYGRDGMGAGGRGRVRTSACIKPRRSLCIAAAAEFVLRKRNKGPFVRPAAYVRRAKSYCVFVSFFFLVSSSSSSAERER